VLEKYWRDRLKTGIVQAVWPEAQIGGRLWRHQN
jgi:hypothetical protein